MDSYGEPMKTILVIILLVSGSAFGQSVLSADVVTSAKTNTFTVKGKTITDYASSKAESWRFVHDGKSLKVCPFFSGGTTYTPYKIVECKTLDIATNEIAKLGLKLTEEQQIELNVITGKPDIKENPALKENEK